MPVVYEAEVRRLAFHRLRNAETERVLALLDIHFHVERDDQFLAFFQVGQAVAQLLRSGGEDKRPHSIIEMQAAGRVVDVVVRMQENGERERFENGNGACVLTGSVRHACGNDLDAVCAVAVRAR